MIYSEKDAASFMCCGPFPAGTIDAEAISRANAADIDATMRLMTLVVLPRCCIGAKCAAWTWVEQEFRHGDPTPNRHGCCGYVAAHHPKRTEVE